MTRVTFETVSLADSLKRASTVAPTRGQSLAVTAGLVFKISPDSDNPVTVLASDGTVFYTESLSILESEGAEKIWRLPSLALAAIITNLPLRSGSSVTFDDQDGTSSVFIKSGRTKVKLAQIDPSGYPLWEPFEFTGDAVIPSFGKLVSRMKWASSVPAGTLRSVFIEPDSLYSTDKFKIARYSIQTGVEDTIVVPNDQLAKILPRDGDVKISSTGSIFVAHPDEFTQIATSTYSESGLPAGRILDFDYKYKTCFSKQDMLAALNRALAFDAGNRQSMITLVLGKGEVAILTSDKEIGLFGEQIDATGSAEDHSPLLRLQVGPVTFRDMLSSLSGEIVNMHYNDPEDSPRIVVFRDGPYSCALALSRRDERSEED